MEAWLRSIGLEARIAAFREHGITLDLIPELTEADLRELGLTIGERKRLQRGRTTLRAPPPAALAERRPLSMMFVDMVGYTRMSERLDPEDMLDLLRRYREFCDAIIVRFGGRIARMVGDGVLAYFCYPVANENDPERAVRAALDIAGGAGELALPPQAVAGERIAVRVGIATGPVVIGDLLSGTAVDQHSVVGSAPNLAARLQALARPGEVVVADETHTRIRGRFMAADLGLLPLHGIEGARRAWRIVRERPVGSHGSVPHQAPLCGRDSELAVLATRWTRARAGEGATILVVGQAGIGKSRLVRALLDQTAGEGASVQLHASALDSDSPLRAVVAALRRLTGGAGAGAEGGRAARLRRLETLGVPPPSLPVLAELLGLAEPHASPDASPERKREAILTALADTVFAVAARTPVKLLVEDIHWLDPTSLDLLRRIAAGLAGRPILLLLTAREEAQADWAQLPAQLSTIRLQRLPEFEVMRMAGAMLNGQDIAPGLLRSIARRAEGVPLFAQELVRTFAARAASNHGDEHAEQQPDGFDAVVPASVQEALVARLDRTGPAREVAQAAAVIRQGCSRALLGAVCAQFGTAPAEVDGAVETLVRAAVFLPEDARGCLVFSHALLRDAAYDTLVRDRRRGLHLAVVAGLRAVEPEVEQEQPERLALHLTEGDSALEAAPLWLEAARRSLARSALTEATRLLRRAVHALPPPATGSAAADARLQLLTLLGPALMALSGPGSAEVAEVYAEANALCQDLPEAPSHFPIYWGWWRLSRDFHDKCDRSSTLLSRARTRRDPELLLQAHHCAWGSHYCAGEFGRCCEHVQAGLAIYEERDFRNHARLYGNHDAKVCAHGELAQVLWMQGKPLRALEQEAESLAWAAHLDHLGSRAHARDMQLLHRVFRRDHGFVFAQASELVSLGSDHGMTDARGKGLLFRGWAMAVCEDAAAGLRALEEGFAQQRATGTDEDFPLYVTLQAEALIAAGRPERALAALSEAEAGFAARGLGFWAPEVRRMRAEATLAADPRPGNLLEAGAALELFAEAQALAEAQGTAMLALRAAIGAGRIALAGGDAAAAVAGLAGPLGSIEGDDGGADLADARVLRERAGVRHAMC